MIGKDCFPLAKPERSGKGNESKEFLTRESVCFDFPLRVYSCPSWLEKSGVFKVRDGEGAITSTRHLRQRYGGQGGVRSPEKNSYVFA